MMSGLTKEEGVRYQYGTGSSLDILLAFLLLWIEAGFDIRRVVI